MGEAKRRKALDPNYGKPKQDKTNGRFSKPIEINKIHYYSINERPESITYEIPESLRMAYIDFIPDLPKSILQIIDPTLWHIESINNRILPNIEFSILFDDYKRSEYENILNSPIKIIVIFLNTKKGSIFSILESLKRPFILLSESKDIAKKIESSNILREKYCVSHENLMQELTVFALKASSTDHDVFLEHQAELENKSMGILKNIGVESQPDFIPCRANISNIEHILFCSSKEFLPLKKTPFGERVSTLVKTSTSLLELSRFINSSTYSDVDRDSRNLTKIDPTLIFIYPYFNPDYKRLIESSISKLKGEERSSAKQFKAIRFLEQSIQDYTQTHENKGSGKNIFFLAVQEQRDYIKFLDFIGYLHSTFSLSPCIRTPLRGSSLNKYLSRVSPKAYKLSHNHSSVRKNIFEVGGAIADNCPLEFLSFIEANSNSILAISDLPIEWMLVDDVPLSFLCDVCRLPESGPTSLLAQFNQNCHQEFIVSKNILSKTLIVCGALEGDPILERFRTQIVSNPEKDKDTPTYKTLQARTKEEFFKALKDFEPDLLIVDSHGNFETQEEGSYIWIGNDKVTSKDIIDKAPQIPLVILSCCLGAPLYGNSNTIAQAFFEQGSFSVVSTFLPISVDNGLILYFRILENLSYASNNPIHNSWSSFISHNLRTSYFEDLLRPAIEKYSLDILDEDKYKKEKTIWLLKCLDRGQRREVYLTTKEVILSCIKEEFREKVLKLLEQQSQFPDSMIYTHLGRGDLIHFEINYEYVNS